MRSGARGMVSKLRRREGALWRLERDLDMLGKSVSKQDGGANVGQVRDMERMSREIAVLKRTVSRVNGDRT